MRKMRVIPVLLAVLLALPGCASTVETMTEEMQASLQEGRVFEPEKRVEYVPYEVVRYVYPDEGTVVDAIEARTDDTTGNAVSSEGLLGDAIDSNTVSVRDSSDFYNSIVEYNFIDGKIYDIWASPRHVTDIRLAPGETISGEAAIGDSESWQLSTAVSNEGGMTVTHIYVKPVTTGLETTMIIPTDYRTYYIRLLSYPDLYMVGVRWKYPGISTFGKGEGASSFSTGISVDVASLNWQYEIKGDDTVWKPVTVYDDGVHTYFQFDPRFSSSAGAPSLYLLQKKNQGASKAELVNYVIRGNMYIADFVIEDNQAWYLMADKKEVKITRE